MKKQKLGWTIEEIYEYKKSVENHIQKIEIERDLYKQQVLLLNKKLKDKGGKQER